MKAKHHIDPSEDDTVIVEAEDHTGRRRTVERYESGFHWNLKGDRWVLFSPKGKVAAEVYLYYDVRGHNWHVWDEDGCGGENSKEETIEQAKITAESAVLRWGKHFK